MVKSQPRSCIFWRRIALLVVLLVLAICSFPQRSLANVYATAVKLNGAFTNVVAGPVTNGATNVVISYVLNEPATAGVTVQVKLGTATVRTFTLSSGPGTSKGTNSVTWNLLD